jgi:hypothetical protein
MMDQRVGDGLDFYLPLRFSQSHLHGSYAMKPLDLVGKGKGKWWNPRHLNRKDFNSTKAGPSQI